ncbi:AcrR family transcriptional regulator [Azospirillum agricola]|uniref:TetR family transcriptional regulator n=1 Tax=Azospirillum agricola TaxID=1720247 RepID=UPI001AE346D5|nr:TetR family transcriptional regulator [Azospirillum agricola]MBP2231063.1 AcrR family transcriptional regulator [Azospirillum agricola]
MARRPTFSDQDIITAGQRLVAAGRPVNKFALRNEVGGGNPNRLLEIWQAHQSARSMESTAKGVAESMAPPHAAARPPRGKAPGKAPPRRNDPEGTRREVLEAAISEFTEKGYSGAKVAAIAARTRTTKSMIYYYFGGKEGLYIAALEASYAHNRQFEQSLSLEDLPPMEALRRLVGVTFDYHDSHQERSRLVSVENIHQARHMKKSASIGTINLSIIDTIRTILERGERDGVFRPGIEPVDLHMLISSFCFFRSSNRYTFSFIFKIDLADARIREQHRRMIIESTLRFVRADGAGSQAA